MKIQSQIVAAVGALLLVGCAATSVERSWKSPSFTSGPVKKLAVIAVDERALLRKGFENRFVRDLGETAQAAVASYELMSLEEIKANKEAAATTLRNAGVDSVLIVRLVDVAAYERQVEARPEMYVPVTTGMDSFYSYGWYDYYTVAFMDMSASWGSLKQQVYLDTSVYELSSGRRLWSTLTRTTVKEDTDRLVEVDKLTEKVVAAMRKDGMVR